MPNLIIIGHNPAGELRYAQTTTAPGVRATGVTPEKAKASTFDSYSEATPVLRTLSEGFFHSYGWRIRDAIVKPCD